MAKTDPDPARAVAAALWRAAERVREYEEAHAPRAGEPPALAQRRAGQRFAALEIREWLEERAREYQEAR